MHARRYFFKALESDERHMGPALHLIARLYAVEDRAKALRLSAEQRFALRQRVSTRLLGKMHKYRKRLTNGVPAAQRCVVYGRIRPEETGVSSCEAAIHLP